MLVLDGSAAQHVVQKQGKASRAQVTVTGNHNNNSLSQILTDQYYLSKYNFAFFV